MLFKNEKKIKYNYYLENVPIAVSFSSYTRTILQTWNFVFQS